MTEPIFPPLKQQSPREVRTELFGYKEGRPIFRYTVSNNNGFSLSCINYGCIITELFVPDRTGASENIVLGFDTIEEYDAYSPYFGAVVGRFAGRIGGGSFELDGKTYQLTANDNGNHLHGGEKGFSRAIWETSIKESEAGVKIEFRYTSPDGEEGYPGKVDMLVAYTVTTENELLIEYEGQSDKKTLLNVTNHSYFNLSGNMKRNVLSHNLKINSDRFLELKPDLLPTGKWLDVTNTAFDFREARDIASGTQSKHPQNAIAHNGYDHPFLLNAHHQQEIIVTDPESGRILIVETDEPCVVLYTGNKLAGNYMIRGLQAQNYMGFCLETQAAPDFVHYPYLPGSILDKNKLYRTSTKYTFAVDKEQNHQTF